MVVRLAKIMIFLLALLFGVSDALNIPVTCPSLIQVRRYTTVSISCNFTSPTEITQIVWTLNKKILLTTSDDPPPTGFRVAENGTLTIQNIQKENEGNYSFVVVPKDPSKFFDIPAVAVEVKDPDVTCVEFIKAIEGESFTSLCKFTFINNMDRVQWSKDGFAITDLDGRYKQLPNNNLLIENVKIDDAGNYTVSIISEDQLEDFENPASSMVFVKVLAPSKVGKEKTSLMVILISLLLFAIVLTLVVCCTIICYRRHKKMKGKDQDKEVPDEELSELIHPDEMREELKEFIEDCDVQELPKILTGKLDEWRNMAVNIAITGSSGVGKSTFINSVIGVKPGDKRAAKTGVIETTMKAAPYCLPQNKKIVLWDLPGIGTQNFKKEDYVEKMKLETFDYFFILTATRFTEAELYLARFFQERERKYSLVRTKVDNDIRTEWEDKKKDPKQVIKDIKDDILSQVTDKGSRRFDGQIFAINCRRVVDFEFDSLINHMQRDLPDLRGAALVLSLAPISKKRIDLKVEELKKRIWKVALSSAAAGAVPIPGCSLIADGAILLHEFSLYVETFGLDSKSLNETAHIYGCSVEDLKELLNSSVLETLYLRQWGAMDFVRALMALPALALIIASDQLLDSTAYWLPIVGSVIASTTSYVTMSEILKYLLNKISEDAKRIIDHATSSQVV